LLGLSAKTDSLLGKASRLFGLLDQGLHVAHPEDPAGETVGVEGVEVLDLLAGGGERDRATDDLLDRQRGAAAGVTIFNYLKSLGQVDLLVKLCYVIFLGIIGGLMFIESLNAIRKSRGNSAPPPRKKHNWIHGLPFKMRFRVSGLYISVIPPLLVGLCVGILAAIMGVGGGFIMVPAMIYLLGMPTKVVVGTSLFQIIFVTAFTTLLHATTNYTVDIVLAVLLLIGGVIGAQFGTSLGTKLKAEQLRILLALLVLVVCGKLALELLLQPAELYSVGFTS